MAVSTPRMICDDVLRKDPENKVLARICQQIMRKIGEPSSSEMPAITGVSFQNHHNAINWRKKPVKCYSKVRVRKKCKVRFVPVMLSPLIKLQVTRR